MHADKKWQVADWLESYAHSLELDVWTSSTVTRASQDPETKKWTVVIERENAKQRTFTVNHLVFAMGIAGGTCKMPQIPGAVRDDVMPDTIKPLITLNVRKNSTAKFYTLSIIRRPKITMEKR
jgi:hypothetical protein